MQVRLTGAIVLWIAFNSVSAGAPTEELSFRGEIVEIDLEASLLVVKSLKAGDDSERLFDVDERSTEIRARAMSELAPGEESEKATPIAFSDLEVGDYVEVQYEVVKGKNVAKLIERGGARHA